jgi:hypothetical protein
MADPSLNTTRLSKTGSKVAMLTYLFVSFKDKLPRMGEASECCSSTREGSAIFSADPRKSYGDCAAREVPRVDVANGENDEQYNQKGHRK